PAVLVECGYLSNRNEGNLARDSEYRELLADRIAEAVVEERYGPDVYHGSTQVAAQPSQPNTSTGSTELAPAAGHRYNSFPRFSGPIAASTITATNTIDWTI